MYVLYAANVNPRSPGLHVGACNQAILLQAFVQRAGAALTSITKLELQLNNFCDSENSASLMDEALTVLVNACPAMQRLDSRGHLSPALMHSLQAACPLLTALKLSAGEANASHVQTVVDLLPTSLPSITSLAFTRSVTNYELPDMSDNANIVDLQLNGFTFQHEAQWLCIPPKLQQLVCGFIKVGPPAITNSTGLLASLISMTLEVDNIGHTTNVCMHAVAQLLCAAEALKVFQHANETESFTFVCSPGEGTAVSAAADIQVLSQRMNISGVESAFFCIKFETVTPTSTYLLPFIASLPCMAGVSQLQIEDCPPEAIPLVLHIFPNLQVMLLDSEEGVDDYDMQALAACKHLIRLILFSCSKVSPMGVMALCQRLPHLSYVGHHACPKMSQPEVTRCLDILKGYGLLVEIVSL